MRIEASLTVLKWMLGTQIALIIGGNGIAIWLMLDILSRLPPQT